MDAGFDVLAQGIAKNALAKANVQPAINLFDPNDIDVAYGYYPVYTSGALGQNAAYNCTGFIPVKAGFPYTRMFIPLNPTSSFQIQQGQVAYYDLKQVYVGGDSGAASTFTPPVDGFMRMAIPVALWWSLQIWQAPAAGVTFWSNLQKEPPERVSHYQMRTLRQSRMRSLSLARNLVVALQWIINMLGDSYLHKASRCTAAFTDLLVSKHGDAGGGWCGFGFLTDASQALPFTSVNQPTYLNGNARPALYPTRIYGSPTSAYYTEALADLAVVTMNPGDAFEQDFPAAPTISTIKMHYKVSAGVIRYGIAAQGSTPTSWTNLDLSAGTLGNTAVATLSLANLVQSGTLRIECVSGAPKVGGVDLQSAAQGVRVNKIAATGGALGQWTSPDATQWQTSFAALGGHLTIIEDGRNSQVATTPASVRDTSLRTLINRVRGQTNAAFGTMDMDVLIYTPPENLKNDSPIAIASYAQADRRRAYLMRCAHINGQVSFGYPGITAEYAAFFEPDLIHPLGTTGGPLMIIDLSEVAPGLRLA